MQFALVNDDRCPPTPKLTGRCVGCGQEMIAKCGAIKIWHWAHKGVRVCDPWWEQETAWHREWKELFPAHWREVIQWSASGEKHIADVRNEAGLVIEFQRSAISREERMAREAFYPNMIWVVDGTRLKNDIPRFMRGTSDLRGAVRPGYFMTRWPNECFPKPWIGSSKPVFFDFGGHDEDPQTTMAARGSLWCLLPGRVGYDAVVARVSKTQFIDVAGRLAHAFPPHEILLEIAAHIEAQRRAEIQRWRRPAYYSRRRNSPRF
ncbi:competence protein CoiA [Agrobacterium tumefaciens]|uniref:Competence protein n=1 Tax=Agrobacterium tumefaciens TaxID=358 RepID=A0A2L2LMT9_AGRTU|nr:competence protein CoiA family protein [Agrobacterium tumefaciens]AVH45661.1 competence protein [Agrobacterium tumefaciens]NSY99321.1 competence protein [Agrobacterium tumefaciens]